MWLDLPLIQQNQIQIRFDHQLPRAWMLPGRYAGSTGSHRNSRIVSADACIIHESANVICYGKKDHLGRIIVRNKKLYPIILYLLLKNRSSAWHKQSGLHYSTPCLQVVTTNKKSLSCSWWQRKRQLENYVILTTAI